jgi:hypothetical protein
MYECLSVHEDKKKRGTQQISSWSCTICTLWLISVREDEDREM